MSSTYRKEPTAIPGGRHAWLVVLGMLAISLLYGVSLGLAVHPLILVGVPVALVVGLLTFIKPQYAGVALLVIEWGYISDILVHFHGMPSISKPLAVLLIGMIIFRRFTGKHTPLVYDSTTWWMLAYLFVGSLGLWYARDTTLATEYTIDLAKHVLMYVVLINLITTTASFKLAVYLMLAFGALLGSLTMYQEATHSYDSDFGGLARMQVAHISDGLEDRPRAGGTTGSPLAYGQQLLVLAPLGFWALLNRRSVFGGVLAAFATIAILAGIGLSFSRSIYVALAVVLLLYAVYIRLNPRYLLILAPLLGGLLWIAPPEFSARIATLESLLPGEDKEGVRSEMSFNRRSVEMLMAVNMFVDYPILGIGGLNYRIYYPEYIRQYGASVPDEERTPHSLYLEVAAEHGLIGLLIWLGILVMAWSRLRLARRLFQRAGDQRMAEMAVALQIGFVGYLVSAIFYHGAYPQFFWLQITMAVALANIARQCVSRSAESPTVVGSRLLTPTIARP